MHPNFTHMDWIVNDIGDEGVKQLNEAMTKNTSLTELVINCEVYQMLNRLNMKRIATELTANKMSDEAVRNYFCISPDQMQESKN